MVSRHPGRSVVHGARERLTRWIVGRRRGTRDPWARLRPPGWVRPSAQPCRDRTVCDRPDRRGRVRGVRPTRSPDGARAATPRPCSTVEAVWTVLIVHGLLLAAGDRRYGPRDRRPPGRATISSPPTGGCGRLRAPWRDEPRPSHAHPRGRPRPGGEDTGAGRHHRDDRCPRARLAWRSAWALLVGLLVGGLVETAATYWVRGFKPRLAWDLGEVRRADRRVKVAVVQAPRYLLHGWRRPPRCEMGRARTVWPLPVSYRIANLPTTEISHAAGRIALPTITPTRRGRTGHSADRLPASPCRRHGASRRCIGHPGWLGRAVRGGRPRRRVDRRHDRAGRPDRRRVHPGDHGYRRIAVLRLGTPELGTSMLATRTVVLFVGPRLLHPALRDQRRRHGIPPLVCGDGAALALVVAARRARPSRGRRRRPPPAPGGGCHLRRHGADGDHDRRRQLWWQPSWADVVWLATTPADRP